MLKVYLLVLLSFFLLGLYAQSSRQNVSANYIGMGAYSNSFVDGFSFTNNPAALAKIKYACAGIYGERRFLLSPLADYTAAVALLTLKGNFGLQLNYFGFKSYNETEASLAYSIPLSERISAGIKFNYFQNKIPGYGNASAYTFEGGMLFKLTSQLVTGFTVYNPVGGQLSNDKKEKLASVYKLGAGYQPSENFLFSVEFEKVENTDPTINAAIHYQFEKRFFLRLGVASTTENAFAAAGIYFKNIRLDVSASYHPQLGVSPGLLLIFNFKKSE